MKTIKPGSAAFITSPKLLVLVLLVLSLIGISCSGRLEASIRNDLSARMALRLEIPEILAARVRQLGSISSKAYLFDTQKLNEEFSGRTSIFLVDVSTPSTDSLTSVIWIPDISAFVSDKSLVPEGMVSLRSIPASGTEPGKKELAIHLTRENAAKAYSIFPGIDGKLLDSLSPPALDKEPISAADYRMNLETVIIGKKSMPAFDACFLDISITAPKTIASAKGGSVQGQVFKARIPLFDLLTLEKPITLSFSWVE